MDPKEVKPEDIKLTKNLAVNEEEGLYNSFTLDIPNNFVGEFWLSSEDENGNRTVSFTGPFPDKE